MPNGPNIPNFLYIPKEDSPYNKITTKWFLPNYNPFRFFFKKFKCKIYESLTLIKREDNRLHDVENNIVIKTLTSKISNLYVALEIQCCRRGWAALGRGIES